MRTEVLPHSSHVAFDFRVRHFFLPECKSRKKGIQSIKMMKWCQWSHLLDFTVTSHTAVRLWIPTIVFSVPTATWLYNTLLYFSVEYLTPLHVLSVSTGKKENDAVKMFFFLSIVHSVFCVKTFKICSYLVVFFFLQLFFLGSFLFLTLRWTDVFFSKYLLMILLPYLEIQMFIFHLYMLAPKCKSHQPTLSTLKHINIILH